ncbi:MAG: NADH-quinone oxidoreductase subunit N [Chloroflexi bacterium]|nr:NADH-quinone oxidoreductase subunit N [Chloroflexota bacterium]
MTLRDLYLLSPEMAMAALASLVVLVDLVVPRTRVLATLAGVGLLVPAALSVLLWGEVGGEASGAVTALSGTLVVDEFSLFFKFLVLGIVGLLIPASVDYVGRFLRSPGEFYALVLFSATGMMLLASTTELVSIYISLELTSLPLAVLAAFLRDGRSSEAGLKFLLLSALSSAILLYGMVLVYGVTGSTRLEEIAQEVARVTAGGGPLFQGPVVLVGVALMVAGFGFKVASVPFQMWVPDVYEGAPTPVTAYLSVGSKAAGFAVLLRVFYVALQGEELRADWGGLFAVLSVASMTAGNLMAMLQGNIKRLLAYSTVAHAGYLLVGLAVVAGGGGAGEALLGPSGVLFYLGAYAASNLAAFFAIIVITNQVGSDQISAFAGMARRAPWLAAALALAMVSLIGIPPTAGFMGKLYLFNAAVQNGMAWLALAGVVNSVVSAYYYLRVVRSMYLLPAESDEPVRASAPMVAALAVPVLGVLLLGVLPNLLLEVAQSAVGTIQPPG